MEEVGEIFKAEGALAFGEQAIEEVLDDHPHDECGVFGAFEPTGKASDLVYLGLLALQHRGQESAGIAVLDKGEITVRVGLGLVTQVFDGDDLNDLQGTSAMGHTRYCTAGSGGIANAQPMLFFHPKIGQFALGHNGNLVAISALRTRLVRRGRKFVCGSDTEVLGALLESTPGDTIEEVLKAALPLVTGAYSLLILTNESMVGVRDPLGVRPLCIGRFEDQENEGGRGYVVASESCALDGTGAKYLEDVKAGEIVSIDTKGVRKTRLPEAISAGAMCAFEFIYFSRPDSEMMGRGVYETRKKMGQILAKESGGKGDIVIAIPDSGTPSAVGFAEERGIPFAVGLIKSKFASRTFIAPTKRLRDAGVRLKFNPIREVLEGQRVILVDDSLVRGTTAKRLIAMIREAGATEVHMRISSPPITWPCFMGIDIASRRELIAVGRDPDQVAELVGADSLRYLSLPGLAQAMDEKDGRGFCFGCISGVYPLSKGTRGEGAKKNRGVESIT